MLTHDQLTHDHDLLKLLLARPYSLEDSLARIQGYIGEERTKAVVLTHMSEAASEVFELSKVEVAGIVSLEVGLRPGESITLQRSDEDGPVNVYAFVDVEDAQKLAAIDAAERAGVIDHKTAEEKRAGTKGSYARARQRSSSHDLTVAVESALVCAREARDRAEPVS